MRFKLDENIPSEICRVLRDAQHNACTVADENLGVRADSVVLATCLREQRVLLSLDLDFADVRNYPPQDFPGIVVLRPHRQDLHSLIDVTERLLSVLETITPSGRLLIAEQHQVRIRESDGLD